MLVVLDLRVCACYVSGPSEFDSNGVFQVASNGNTMSRDQCDTTPLKYVLYGNPGRYIYSCHRQQAPTVGESESSRAVTTTTVHAMAGSCKGMGEVTSRRCSYIRWVRILKSLCTPTVNLVIGNV